ncbi:MAG: hypothetical protein HOW73_14635 [Polyangiaceae bacterium]|nr:hypothetical protein [Polyangiaceae bacterium]
MNSSRSLLAIVSLGVVVFAAGCGDSSAETGGNGGNGGDASQGGAPLGGGGAGGAEGCPVGSHDDGTGACVAELGAFTEGPKLTDERDHHMTWAAKKQSGTYLYAAGGHADQESSVTTIERSTIQADGSMGAWETLSTSDLVAGAVMVSTDDVVVIAGGYRTAPSTSSVDIMTIDDNGNLSDPADGPSMNDARFHGAGVLVDGWVYAAGGMALSGSSLATVERARLDGSELQPWSYEADLPYEVSHHGLTTDGEALYLTGGLKRVNGDFENDLNFDKVLRARIADDGSLEAWEEIGTVPTALSVHASFIHAGKIYLVGGLEPEGVFTKTVHRASISADGALGEWETLDVALPISRGHVHQNPMINGVIYSVGGFNVGGSQTRSFFARFE